jgi:hypothetical protein
VRELPWHGPSSCLWSSKAPIKGKIKISEHYPDLEQFFVECLGVTEPSLRMLVDELKSVAELNPKKKRIKKLIFAINSLLPGEPKVPAGPILELNILPVDTAEGVRLKSAMHDFAINDRQQLWEAFRGEASMLIFKLEEVRTLRPFIQWLDLERRYLSRTVKEITRNKSNSERLSNRLTQWFRGKAHALFRSVNSIHGHIGRFLSPF